MAQKGETVAARYRLLERLGGGALGEVWAARDDRTEREFAVKLIRPRWSIDPKSLDGYFREAKAAARIRHASIVELFDAGDAEVSGEQVPYVVMELLEAEKLEELLDRVTTLEVGTALRLVSELAWALVAAHERSIVHERIEPANVLLHRDVRGQIVPKLVDFGVARLVEDLAVLPGTPHEALSPLGYLSPEQIHADVELEGRADVFGLAALLHRCLVGTAPFAGETVEEILERIDEGPHKLEQFEPPIDNRVIQLLGDALQRNRKLRPTMRVFAERIDAIRERIDADWPALAAMVQIPEERTVEHIATLRPAKALGRIQLVKRPAGAPPIVAREEIAPLSPRPDPRGDDVEPISVIPESVPESAARSSAERISSSELEEVPPSSRPPHAPLHSSGPPPLPKPGLADAPLVSEIIRAKMTRTGNDPLALEVLADLEKELLKHVAARDSLPEPTPPPPDTGLFKGSASVPPESSVLYAPAPASERSREPETVDERRSAKSLPTATAKTVPPDQVPKSSGAIWIVGALIAIVIVGVVMMRQSGAGADAAGSSAEPAAPSMQFEPPVASTVFDPPPVVPPAPPPVSSVASSASSTEPAAPMVSSAKPIAPPPPKPFAAPPPKPTAAATTPPAATPTPAKPTNDPTFGVDNAGF